MAYKRKGKGSKYVVEANMARGSKECKECALRNGNKRVESVESYRMTRPHLFA